MGMMSYDKEKRREKWEKKSSFTKKNKKNRYSFDKRPRPEEESETFESLMDYESDSRTNNS